MYLKIANLSQREKGIRLSDQVYERVVTDIVEGKYREGERLPSELALAEKFSVSRPVIREALTQLRDDGLITGRQGSGSYVQKRPTTALLEFTPVGSIADIQRCFEFRAAVEPKAAYLAALRRSHDDLHSIENALKTLDSAVSAKSIGTDADFAFHMAIAIASGNSFFEVTLSSLEQVISTAIAVNRNLSLIAPKSRLESVQQEHQLVFDMIKNREGEGAENAMRLHIEAARNRIFDGDDPPLFKKLYKY